MNTEEKLINELGTYLIISVIVLILYNRILILLYKYNRINKIRNLVSNKTIFIIRTVLLIIITIHFILNIINQRIWIDKIIIIETLINCLLYPKMFCSKINN